MAQHFGFESEYYTISHHGKPLFVISISDNPGFEWIEHGKQKRPVRLKAGVGMEYYSRDAGVTDIVLVPRCALALKSNYVWLHVVSKDPKDRTAILAAMRTLTCSAPTSSPGASAQPEPSISPTTNHVPVGDKHLRA
jgi:hypothetical protein